MKKITAFVASLALVASLSPAFAGGPDRAQDDGEPVAIILAPNPLVVGGLGGAAAAAAAAAILIALALGGGSSSSTTTTVVSSN